MESKANYVLVGAFVLAGLVLLAIFVGWLVRSGDHRRYDRYAINFQESVSGLSEGSIVRFRGIQVGRVFSLGLDPKNPEQVRVVVDIDDKLPIRVDTTASMKYQGVTGLSFIELTNGQPTSPKLEAKEGEEYPVITSTPSAVEKVMARVPEIIDRLGQVTERLNRAMGDENLAAFGETLGNLRTFSNALVSNRQALETLVGDASKAMKSVGESSRKFQRVVDKVDEDVIDAVHSLRDVTEEAHGILADNRGNLADFSATGLTSLPDLFVSAQNAAIRADRLAERLADNPSQLVYPPASGGYYLP